MNVIQAFLAIIIITDKKIFCSPKPENDVHFHVNIAGTAKPQEGKDILL